MSTEEVPTPRRPGGGDRPVLPDFRVGDRRVRPCLNRIITPTATLQLEPKVMQVLASLARHPGELVTKERLFEEVWEGAFVTEDVLTRAIGELRRAFDDDAAKPCVIETIRKSGYRLIAPVETESAGPGSSTTAPSIPAPARPPRLGRAFAIAALVALAALVAFVALRSRPTAPLPMRIRPLTSYPGNQRDPAVSPDGSRVAFAWNGGSGDDYSLYVRLIDAEMQLRLTREPGVQDRVPTWSPGGERVAFARLSPAGCEIRIVSALGGPERPLAPCGDRDFIRMTWSPDGRQIALSRRDGHSQISIELVSIETLERRRLTQPPPGIVGDSSPAFSPNGRTVVFARNVTDGVSDIYRVAVSGGEPTRLTFDDRDIVGADWSSDGKSVLFSSSRAGIYSLWRVPASGGEPMWVAGGGMKMKHPSAARARNVVAYENWLYEVNVWRIALADSRNTATKLTETTDEWNFGPRISPDGQSIAFVSTRSGSEEIWVCGAQGDAPRRLTSIGGARLETPSWSPDGRRILFSARQRGVAQLYAVDGSGGVVEQMTTGSTDAVAPAWSHDGRSVYFASRKSGSWQILKMDITSHRTASVTISGGYSSRESPEGTWLYFTRADAPGIWRQPVAGGSVEPVFDRLAPEDWANWQLGTAGLYFRELCAKHPGPAVAFLRYGTNQPVDLFALDEQGWSDFDVSADGQWLVYPRVDRHSCDIRLIENPS